MINKFATAIFGWAATSACAATLFLQPAQAGTLVGDWYYSPDSTNDSMMDSNIGGTKYEIHNMAMQQTSDEVIFAINSNLSLSGTGSQYAHDGHIAWGDLFMNFTGQSLDAANNAGDLFGIRSPNI
ncbi:MAG: hypothetical protein F6K03_09875, partial [Kamptonema sp. SIO4C4]|nr:hypothetical protein [Kamptonema sp. SIO4C4]